MLLLAAAVLVRLADADLLGLARDLGLDADRVLAELR